MGVRSTMQNLYPRLLALHGLADDVAFPDDDVSPPLMRDSHLYMEACGVYLIGTYTCRLSRERLIGECVGQITRSL